MRAIEVITSNRCTTAGPERVTLACTDVTRKRSRPIEITAPVSGGSHGLRDSYERLILFRLPGA